MKQSIAARLLQLNQQFYERFAAEFADTRGPQQPGLIRLLDCLPVEGAVLDVGCGNGRLAHLLEGAGRPLRYVGVDASAELLQLASSRAAHLDLVTCTFLQADVAGQHWISVLADEKFNAVTLLAVLHHLPGWRLRTATLAGLRSALAPDGILAVSTWQFLTSERLRRKIVPWETIGLASSAVDPGDYLLDWRRGGLGLRYCRWIGQNELSQLARSAGYTVRETFLDDGRERNLNLFGILTVTKEPRSSEPAPDRTWALSAKQDRQE